MIELGHVTAGNYVESSKAIYWDGRTQDGEQVSSGTYFYQIEAGDYTETRKMVVLKYKPSRFYKFNQSFYLRSGNLRSPLLVLVISRPPYSIYY